MTESNALHLKYRPKTLDKIVGHKKVVASLKGIVESGKWPSAIGFFGPTSAGKTTLTNALVSTVFEGPADGHPDFTAINASDSKSIDDVRALIAIAQKRPSRAPRRFIFIDEAQGLLSNQQAANALLVPLEKPHPHMTWIIGSMEPAKFDSTQTGKAIRNRCTCFILSEPSEEDLAKYAKRIIKGEEITFITEDHIQTLVEGCDRQMRQLANIIQQAASYYHGLGKEAPKKLSAEDFTKILSSAQSDDAVTAVRILTCVYAGKFAAAQREVLNIADGFGVINKMLQLNWYVLNDKVLKGARHPNVWGSVPAYTLQKQIKEFLPEKDARAVDMMGQVQEALSRLKAQAQAFSIPETMAISSFAFNTIQALKAKD